MEIKEYYEDGPQLIVPKIFSDNRGYFFESFNDEVFKEYVADVDFVQDNESKSSYGTVRGMHFQKPPFAQAKLVRVVKGSIVDFVVDLRKKSPNYKKISYAYLSDKNHYQFFIPRGFAHGFVALEDDTILQYKCDNFYNKESEDQFTPFDKELEIPWDAWIKLEDVKMSLKDSKALELNKIQNPF